MADFEFEPGETERLRHAPGWVDVCVVALILLVEFTIILTASNELAAEAMRYEQGTLALVIVAALFIGGGLQFLVLIMPPMVEVTDLRILRRRRLGWDDPEALRLEAIEEISQRGWRLVVSGEGTSLEFFCPPAFAPRIRAAIGRSRAAESPRRRSAPLPTIR